MDAVIRPVLLYVFVLAVFAVAGKRTLAEMNAFDLVMLLVVGEAAQNALVGQNQSMTFALLVILTLAACSTFMAWLKARRPKLEQALQGGPVILVEHGVLQREAMRRAMVDEQDILSAARRTQGLERLDQVKYAILETSGEISVIRRE